MTSVEPDTPANPRPVHPDGPKDPNFRVFFDADILIGQSESRRRLQQRILFRLFFSHKRIELLTTEFTRIQVAKNRAEKACNDLKFLSNEKAAKLARDLFSVDIPIIERARMYRVAYDSYLQQITDETSDANWRCVEYNAHIISNVFTEYGQRRGFFSDHVKTGQFADAIIFEMLRPEATVATPVIIFSRDKDFSAVYEYDENIRHVKSWGELIDALGIREDIPEADQLLKRTQVFIVEQVHEHLSQIWNDVAEKFRQVQDEPAEIGIKKVEARSTGGIIFENRTTDDGLLWEEFMLTGELQVCFHPPKGMPVFIAPNWSTVEGEATGMPGEPVDVTCDVAFAITGRRARSQNNVDLLEIKFGDGSVGYFVDVEI